MAAAGHDARQPLSDTLRTENRWPPTALTKFYAVIVLSLPTIVGTAFFVTGVIVSKLRGITDAGFDPFGEPSRFERLEIAVGFALFLACYFGAAFGPLLLPLAAQQAFGLTRTVGVRSSLAIWAWTSVVLGLVATALFWG